MSWSVGAWMSALLLLTSGSVSQAQLVWDGATGNWATPTNWNPDFVPTNALSASINNGGTAQIGAASFANGLYLGLGPGQSGYLEIGTGGSLVVTAGASTYTFVGDFGTGSIDITGGGTLTTNKTYLGVDPGGSGTVNVSGAGSTWTVNDNGGEFQIGSSNYGEINVLDGGLLTSNATILGGDDTGEGVVTISGTNSRWNTTLVYVGYDFASSGNVTVQSGGARGTGAISITDEGQMTIGILELGRHEGGDGTLSVSGIGSGFAVGDGNPDPEISVGYGGHGFVEVLDGGLVQADSVNVARRLVLFVGGDQPENIVEDSIGSGQVTISGAGSKFEAANEFILGEQGVGNLLIENGGTLDVTGTSGELLAGGFVAGGNSVPTSEGHVIVRGENSLLQAASHISIGYNSVGTLDASDRAQLISNEAYVGRIGDGDGTATLSDQGGKWTVATDFYIAALFDTQGDVTLESGAEIEVGEDLIMATNTGGVGDLRLRAVGTVMTANRAYLGGEFGTAGGPPP